MAAGGCFGRCVSVLLLASSVGACHGRPLESQMAPGSEARSSHVDRRVAKRRELDRYARARKLFEGRSPLSPVENVMERDDYQRLAEAQARRDPRISEPRTPETFVRGQVNEVLQNPAKPSFETPGKAFRPGEICLDPLTLTIFVIQILRNPDAFVDGFREAQRKDKPGR